MSFPQRINSLTASPLFLQIYAPTFLLALARGLLLPVLPLYLHALGASYGLIGLAMAAQELGTLLADMPAGILLRRLGRKRSMVLGLVVFVLSLTLLFGASSLPETMALRFLGGVWCGAVQCRPPPVSG